MKSLARVGDNLQAILDEIERNDGAITPEQERTLNGALSDLSSAASALYNYSIMAKRLKLIEKLAREYRKSVEATDGTIRDAMPRIMAQLGETKVTDPDELCSCGVQQGKGAIELAPGMVLEDVDPFYLTNKVETVINKDLARPVLEAGREIQGLRFKKDDHVVLRKTAKGKLAEAENEALGLLEAYMPKRLEEKPGNA